MLRGTYLLYIRLEGVYLLAHLVDVACELLIIQCEFFEVVCALGCLL